MEEEKKRGIGKTLLGFGIFIFIIGFIGSFGEDNSPSDSNPQNVGTVVAPNKKPNNNSETKNEFKVGDIIETSNFKISFISSEEWTSDNQYIQPKDGYAFYRFEFEFENISDTDQYVSAGDFCCYADDYSVDMSYYGDDVLSITSLSAGKKAKGSVYFEVPKDATSIVLEYTTNFWTENKVIFNIK